MRPFSRRRLAPSAGQATEILAGQATYAVEVEAGYQAGTRLALENLRVDGEPSLQLADGAVVPLGGISRAWILWPAGAIATPLELTLWHLPEVAYERRLGGAQLVSGTVAATQGTSPWVVGDGGGSLTVDGTVGISGTVPVSAAALPLPAGASTAALQEVSIEATYQLLAHAIDVSVASGSNVYLPSSSTYYEINTGLTAGGASAKLPRSRLQLWVSQTGGSTGTGDAVIHGDHGTGLAASAFAPIHGSRFGGVGSLPVGAGFIIIDIPCPYGRFHVEITAAGGGSPLMSYMLMLRKEHS